MLAAIHTVNVAEDREQLNIPEWLPQRNRQSKYEYLIIYIFGAKTNLRPIVNTKQPIPSARTLIYCLVSLGPKWAITTTIIIIIINNLIFQLKLSGK